MFHVCAKFMSFWKIDIYELPIPLETQTRVIEFFYFSRLHNMLLKVLINRLARLPRGPYLLPEIKEE